MITLYSKSPCFKSPIDPSQDLQAICAVRALGLADETNAFDRNYSMLRFVRELNEAQFDSLYYGSLLENYVCHCQL